MDKFGNKVPVLIEIDEWWFNGRIIQQQKDSRLPEWISFPDNDEPYVSIHTSFDDATKYCFDNPVMNPKNLAQDYI